MAGRRQESGWWTAALIFSVFLQLFLGGVRRLGSSWVGLRAQTRLPVVLIALAAVCVPFVLAGTNNELIDWRVDRFINCIFCMDYDDRQRLNIFGCSLAVPPSCVGNICYMRQHKSSHYYLYTSGCLNLTQTEFDTIDHRIHTRKPERGAHGTETQLCEVTPQLNACVCTNRASCNNVSSGEPFTEFTYNILSGINFDEMAHFRYFAPNDPILETFAEIRSSRRSSHVAGAISDAPGKSFELSVPMVFVACVYLLNSL